MVEIQVPAFGVQKFECISESLGRNNSLGSCYSGDLSDPCGFKFLNKNLKSVCYLVLISFIPTVLFTDNVYTSLPVPVQQ